ncbi:MAG: hypothetical protein R3B09_27255 [Nannocystaceae bacterium]
MPRARRPLSPTALLAGPIARLVHPIARLASPTAWLLVLAAACTSREPSPQATPTSPEPPPSAEDTAAPTPTPTPTPTDEADADPSAPSTPNAEAAPSSAPAEAVDAIDLGPLVGGRRRLEAPKAGRYAARIRGSQRRYITMEHSIDESIDGGAAIDLRPDGAVHACFWGSRNSVGAVSRFASRDGRNHRNENASSFRLGARGTWTSEPGARRAIVRLETFAWNRCDPDAEAWSPPTPAEMTCHALAPGGELRGAALVCRPPAEPRRIDEVSMALEPSPRSGPGSSARA